VLHLLTTNRIRLALGLVILAAAWGAFATRNTTVVVLLVVTTLLFATGFGMAGKAASALEGWRGRRVAVSVWSLRGAGLEAGEYRVVNIWALGAGLHIYIATTSGRRVHIKIAQPQHYEVQADRLVIENAKYVQVAGRTMPRTSTPAFIMEVIPSNAP
jgi:hypothetical protein